MMGSFVFPVTIPRLSIYIRVLDGKGKYPFRLRMVHLKDETQIAEIHGELNIADPLHASEVVVNMMGIQLPSPGKYEFQFYVQDIYLHRATMELIQIQGGAPWQPLQ